MVTAIPQEPVCGSVPGRSNSGRPEADRIGSEVDPDEGSGEPRPTRTGESAAGGSWSFDIIRPCPGVPYPGVLLGVTDNHGAGTDGVLGRPGDRGVHREYPVPFTGRVGIV